MAVSETTRKSARVTALPGAIPQRVNIGLYPIALSATGKQRIDYAAGLKLQWMPQDVKHDRETTYVEVTPIGMNDPKHFYAGGKSTVTLEVGIVSNRHDRADVLNVIDKLASFMRNNGPQSPPPILYVNLGALTNSLNFNANRWILKDVGGNFKVFSPVNDYGPTFYSGTITLVKAPNANIRSSVGVL